MLSRFEAVPVMPILEINVMPQESILDVATFVEGIVGGFAQRGNLSEITTCLSAIDTDEAEIEEIIKDFEQPSIQSIIDGAKKLVQVITDKNIQECGQLNDDIAKIETWGSQIFTNPAAILERVIKNAGDILTEVPKVESDYTAGNFKQSGDDIAQIVVDVFGAPSSSMPSVY